jgi:aryl-alcohol dehydrogenase-like predicted oxidoreductase
LLTGKITPDYTFSPGDTRPDTPHFQRENLIKTNRFLDELKPLAREKGATLSQLVIQWTLQQPGITVALVGARTDVQVKENAGALQVNLAAEELGMINRKLDALALELE